MTSKPRWRTAPVLGVRDVRQTAEYYRDVLGFVLDPERGVFQGVGDEPGRVYAIVERDGIYVNSLDAHEGHRINEAYGVNYERRRPIKRKYDPTNFFQSIQNIPP